MRSACIAPLRRRAAALLASIRRDTTGAAAIEFAFLVPVMLVMLLGTIEVSRGISMDRRFSLVTSMVGDLVAREKTIGPTPTAAMFGIMKSAKTIMAPYDSSTLKLKILSVMALKADTKQGTVKWAYDCTASSCTLSATSSTCNAYALPAGIVSQGSSVVIVESKYNFSPLFTHWTKDPMKGATWNDKSTHSPRQVCVDDGSGCTAPTACPNG